MVLAVGSRSAAHSLSARRNKAKPVGCPVAVQHDDETRRADFNCLSIHNMSGACNSKHENAALAVSLICKQAMRQHDMRLNMLASLLADNTLLTVKSVKVSACSL